MRFVCFNFVLLHMTKCLSCQNRPLLEHLILKSQSYLGWDDGNKCVGYIITANLVPFNTDQCGAVTDGLSVFSRYTPEVYVRSGALRLKAVTKLASPPHPCLNFYDSPRLGWCSNLTQTVSQRWRLPRIQKQSISKMEKILTGLTLVPITPTWKTRSERKQDRWPVHPDSPIYDA